MFTFKLAVVGGTFDHLHEGHKELLDKAFKHSAKVQIGLTEKELQLEKVYPNLVQAYDDRKKTLQKYLEEKKYIDRCEIITIKDIYGTTVTDKNIQAIFITEENIPNVEKINSQRHKRGFPILEAVVIPYRASTNGDVVSSGKIRSGTQSRAGESYLKLLLHKKQNVLPESLRKVLHEPIDTLVHEEADIKAFHQRGSLIIAVGDVIATSLHAINQLADINVIDHKTRRHTHYTESKILEKSTEVTKTTNEQGTVERAAVKALQSALSQYQETQQKQTLLVTGEEDLLVIPAVLLAPLGSLVVYGQYDRGIVVVRVTEEKKEEVAALFRKFT